MTPESTRAPAQDQHEIPIVCSLPEEEKVRRRGGALAGFTSNVSQVNELADGYELRFPGSPEWVAKLTQFIADERACCSFITFELIFEPEQGPVWLRMRGRDGVKAFVRGMLRPADA